jgi:hypothetical protein
VGTAAGILITALHLINFATLTHTPNPMGLLSRILERPAKERPSLIIPAGYPTDDCQVPAITLQTVYIRRHVPLAASRANPAVLAACQHASSGRIASGLSEASAGLCNSSTQFQWNEMSSHIRPVPRAARAR